MCRIFSRSSVYFYYWPIDLFIVFFSRPISPVLKEGNILARQKEFDETEALQAAKELFWAKGYEKTSLSDLLEAMHIHKKSFYDTFGNKRDLFIAALQKYHDEVEADMKEKVLHADNGIEKIRAVFTSSLELDAGKNRGCLLINTAAENFEDDPEIQALILKWDKELLSCFTAFLTEAKTEGLLSGTCDIKAQASLLENAFLGFRMQMKMHRTGKELRNMIEQCIQTYCPGG